MRRLAENVHHFKKGEKKMNKTKLGVSEGLLAAACFASALVSPIITAVLAAYVLLKEEDEWLRKSVVKAVAIVCVFALCTSAVAAVTNVFGVLDSVAGWVLRSANIHVPLNLDRIISNLLSIYKTLLLLACSFQALNKGTVRIGFIDKLIDKYM
jgi:hypothetical protein